MGGRQTPLRRRPAYSWAAPSSFPRAAPVPLFLGRAGPSLLSLTGRILPGGSPEEPQRSEGGKEWGIWDDGWSN